MLFQIVANRKTVMKREVKLKTFIRKNKTEKEKKNVGVCHKNFLKRVATANLALLRYKQVIRIGQREVSGKEACVSPNFFFFFL